MHIFNKEELEEGLRLELNANEHRRVQSYPSGLGYCFSGFHLGERRWTVLMQSFNLIITHHIDHDASLLRHFSNSAVIALLAL